MIFQCRKFVFLVNNLFKTLLLQDTEDNLDTGDEIDSNKQQLIQTKQTDVSQLKARLEKIKQMANS